MRIIYLNIEHASEGKKVFDYLLSESANTDLFCLEEIDENIFNSLQKKLDGFRGYWSKKDVQGVTKYCLSIFANKKYKVVNNMKVLDNNIDFGYSLAIQLHLAGATVEIVCVHGKSQPADKLDNPDRIKQSQTIIDFLSRYDLPKIIGGDFNLMPETKSVKLFERAGYRNLIKDYKIKTTRSKNAWKKALKNFKQNGVPYVGKQLFADYVFVSSEVKVKSFNVPIVEISDHLPLVLDFEL